MSDQSYEAFNSVSLELNWGERGGGQWCVEALIQDIAWMCVLQSWSFVAFKSPNEKKFPGGAEDSSYPTSLYNFIESPLNITTIP